MGKYIIFGCGEFGKAAYYKLNKQYTILGYTDNDKDLWEKKILGLKVISPEEAVILCETQNAEFIIASNAYLEIRKQLEGLGIKSCVIWREGFLYKYDDRKFLYPIQESMDIYCKKSINKKMSVLFVQTTACIRTHKIARALSEQGIKVSLAYTLKTPEMSNQEYASCYEKLYPICSMNGFLDFINNSDFDILHCSNEPDMLTTLLTNSNKPIVHDCHDLSSAYKSMTPDEMVIEYVANVKSNGVIYTTEGIREVACRKFSIERNKTFVLENLISEKLQPPKRLPKISSQDGVLHCVYEGGIIDTDRTSHRFFEEIWKKVTDYGIHIHFYSPYNEAYCRYLEGQSEYLHYEGNISSKELAVEMSKYDVGLFLLNINDKNKQYLEYASPNKIQEYANAGLPIAVGNIRSQVNYVEKYGLGKKIDLTMNIKKQMEDIAKMKIPNNILQIKNLTLESKIPDLISFYEYCLCKKKVAVNSL